MSRVLRINGVVADMDSTTKINLSYRSPIFGDLQKLATNTTLTIKLPLSAANRLLIKNVNITGVQSEFPYNYFRVDYEDNGLLIIDNGIGYLLAISDKIEISVIFGGVSTFANMKDAKLNEMPIDVAHGQIDWDGSQFEGLGPRSDIKFIQMDYGMGVATSTEYAHPVVRVPKIISWINEAYGLNIAPIGQGLVVPCITKNSRENYRTPYTSLLILKQEAEINLGRIYLYPDMFDENTAVAGSFKLHKAAGFSGEAIYNSDVDFTIEMTVKLATRSGEQYILTDVKPVRICVAIEGMQEWYTREAGSTKLLAVTIPKGKRFQFICQVPVVNVHTQQYVGLKMTLNIADGEQLTSGEKFDTLYNLPAMKVTEFIKAIMQIEGKFPQLTPNGIGWVSVDDIYAKIPDAVDWSDKLNKIVSQDFKLDGYAQINVVKWAEDETVALIDEGIIQVENKALEARKELIKLPFAASDSIDTSFASFARVPIYIKEVEDDGTETIEYNEVKPRIIEETGLLSGLSSGSFTSWMNLSGDDGILARCYSKYLNVVRRPRTIKCEMMLSTIDIAGLDLMRPVFIEQLHGYFAILSATTKDNITDVELLKL